MLLARSETNSRSLLRLFAAIFFAGLVVAGCVREQPIYKVVANPVPNVSQPLSQDEVRQRILAAAELEGWIITDAQPGRMIAEMRWRSHAAIVAIIYDENSYSIDYKDSVNLLVGRIPEGMIHREYNMRVRDLETAISRSLLRPRA